MEFGESAWTKPNLYSLVTGWVRRTEGQTAFGGLISLHSCTDTNALFMNL
jgi:hypothetical protein